METGAARVPESKKMESGAQDQQGLEYLYGEEPGDAPQLATHSVASAHVLIGQVRMVTERRSHLKKEKP